MDFPDIYLLRDFAQLAPLESVFPAHAASAQESTESKTIHVTSKKLTYPPWSGMFESMSFFFSQGQIWCEFPGEYSWFWHNIQNEKPTKLLHIFSVFKKRSRSFEKPTNSKHLEKWKLCGKHKLVFVCSFLPWGKYIYIYIYVEQFLLLCFLQKKT